MGETHETTKLEMDVIVEYYLILLSSKIFQLIIENNNYYDVKHYVLKIGFYINPGHWEIAERGYWKILNCGDI